MRNLGTAKRSTRIKSGSALAATVLIGTLISSATAATPAAASTSTSTSPYRIVGPAATLPLGAQLIGPEPPGTKLHIDVELQPRDPAGLRSYATAVATPGDPQYHQFLPKGVVGPMFGASPGTITTVVAALRRAGLQPGPVSADGLSIPVYATAQQASGAFRTPIASYRLTDGRTAFANEAPISLPASVASAVEGVFGLDDLVQPKPLLVRDPRLPAKGTGIHAVAKTSGTTPAITGRSTLTPCYGVTQTQLYYGGYTAPNLAQAYSLNGLYAKGDVGAGTTIGLFEADDFLSSDIGAFEQCYGLSSSIYYEPVDGGASDSSAGAGEATLDIETTIQTAPRAAVIVYDIPPTGGFSDTLDEYAAMLADDSAQVISVSYGLCEALVHQLGSQAATAEDQLFQEMATQGQSVLVASGDEGSEGCSYSSNPVTVPVGANPEQVVVDSASGTAYVVGFDDEVSIVSEATGRVISTFTLPTGTSEIQVDATSRKLLVLTLSGMSVYDTATCNQANQSNCAPTATLTGAPSGADAFTLDPSTGTIYMPSALMSASVISEATGSLVATIPAPSGVGTDGRLPGAVFDAETGDLVQEYGTSLVVLPVAACNATIQTGCSASPTIINVPEVISDSAVNPVTGDVYVMSGSLYAVDVQTGTVSAPVAMNSEMGITSMAVTPNGESLLLSGTYELANPYQGDGEVAIYSTSTLHQTTAFAPLDEPQDMAVDPTAGYVLVADRGDSTLAFLGVALGADDPASQPFVTAVGGTSLTSASAPPSETTWDDPLSPTYLLPEGAGGGGISTEWPMPSYQDGIVSPQSSGAPCGAASGDCREVPDVSADADPNTGFIVAVDGYWTIFGGTSGATPLWAALVALAEAQTSPATRLGPLNPTLYRLPRSVLNDVTTGNNDVTTTNNGTYAAGPGYDMATGLGTPIGSSLALDLVPLAAPGLTGSAGSGAVTLRWTAPQGGLPVTGYEVLEGTSSGHESPTPVNASPITSDSYSIGGLTDGRTYYFQVVSRSSLWVSPASNQVALTPACPSGAGPGQPDAVSIAAVSIGGCPGYFVVDSVGQVSAFGSAVWRGDLSRDHLAAPIISMEATSDGGGYWLVGADGGVFTFGDARFYGSTGGVKLNAPVVGLATTSDSKGYWIVAKDGGIFSFGDARFFGSTGDIKLNQPVDGIAVAPGGSGYWLVASDGGVFTFTKYGFYGSLGRTALVKPVIGMSGTSDARGYTLVASDGGVFAFGAAHFYGSLGGKQLAAPIVDLSTAPGDNGYYLVTSAGAVYAFGPAAKYLGGV